MRVRGANGMYVHGSSSRRRLRVGLPSNWKHDFSPFASPERARACVCVRYYTRLRPRRLARII